jgi:tetratricopeptide (TPR) repeat protein
MGSRCFGAKTKMNEQISIDELLEKAVQFHQQKQYSKAEDLYRKVLSTAPENVSANFYMGLLAFQLSNPKVSLLFLLETLKLDEKHIRAHYYLARVLVQMNNLDKAIEAVKLTMQLDPLWSAPYVLLGSLYRNQGLPYEALSVFDVAKELGVTDVRISSNRANCFLHIGEVEKAIEIYKGLIDSGNVTYEVLNNLGQAQVMLGNYKEALIVLLKAMKGHETEPTIHRNIASVYTHLKEYSKANDHIEKAMLFGDLSQEAFTVSLRVNNATQQYDHVIEIAKRAVTHYPDSISFKTKIAEAYHRLKKWSEALCEYQIVLGIDPDNVNAYHKSGMVEITLGDVERGIRSLVNALHKLYGRPFDTVEDALLFLESKSPEPNEVAATIITDFGNTFQQRAQFDLAKRCYHLVFKLSSDLTCCFRYLAMMHNYIDVDHWLNKIKEIDCKDERWTVLQRVDIHFAKGILLDSIGKYDLAFQSFQLANALYRSQIQYCAKEAQNHLTLIQRVFESRFDKSSALFPALEITPIFIVGMIRSGTSLFAEILSSHSYISSAGETSAFSNSIQRVCQRSDALLSIRDITDEQFVAVRNEYQEQVRKETNGTGSWIINKLNHNFLYLGIIRKIFPEAIIIHVKRSPKAVGLSIYQRYFAEPQNFAYSLDDIADSYKQYKQIMTYWESQNCNVKHVNYKDIIQDPRREFESIFSEQGCEWEDQQAYFYKKNTAVYTASVVQVRQPLYRDSLEKWRGYEEYLGPLMNL